MPATNGARSASTGFAPRHDDLHTGDDLRKIGGPGTHHSYGSAWANLGNTPLRLYKHFTHEGGISTPFIAHWPAGIGTPDQWIREPAHVMDLMPTLIEAAGANYPEEFRGTRSSRPRARACCRPCEARACPTARSGSTTRPPRTSQGRLEARLGQAHAARDQLGTLQPGRRPLRNDDLADDFPHRVEVMAAEWQQWARRVSHLRRPRSDGGRSARCTDSPVIVNRVITVTGEIRGSRPAA